MEKLDKYIKKIYKMQEIMDLMRFGRKNDENR